MNKYHGYDIQYEILERDDRVGGRIKTHRFDYPKGFDENWQYSDMGAMRLPIHHATLFDLIDFCQ